MKNMTGPTEQILAAAWVVPIEADPVSEGAVLVRDGVIVAVGPAGEVLKQAGDAAVRRDFGHAAILPGLVNAHTHIEESVFRGSADTDSFVPWTIKLTSRMAALTPEQRLASARLGALEAVRAGITTVGDVGADATSAKALKEAGLRGISYVGLAEMDHRAISRGYLDTVRESVTAFSHKTGDRVMPGVFLEAPYAVHPEIYKAVCHWAWDRKVPVASHLATGSAEREFVHYGSSALATEYWSMMGWQDLMWQPMGEDPLKFLEQWDVLDGPITAVGVSRLTDQDLDLILEYGVKVVCTPRFSAKLGAGTPPLGRLSRRKIPLALATETVAGSNNMDMFDEMRIALYLHRGSAERDDFGLVARDMLRMGTMGGAEVLGLEAEVGSIEAGKRADLMVLNLSGTHQTPVREIHSAIVYAANEEDVLYTMVDGETLYDEGRTPRVDDDAILAAGNQVRHELAGS